MDLQERIERSFYEQVRLRIVADGYTPDITTYPDTPSGFEQYEEDLKSILDSRGFAAEVYGMSNPEDKGYKKLARVVLITDNFIQGEFGIENKVYYEPNLITEKFDAVTPTQTTSHQLFMKCYIVCDDTAQYRYLTGVINSTIPLRGYLPYYDNTEDSFFVENTSYLDISTPTHGILEKIYTYRVPDIIWTEPYREENKAAPIEHINLLIQKKLGLLTSEDDYWINDAP